MSGSSRSPHSPEQSELFARPSGVPVLIDVVSINARCSLRTTDGHRVVSVGAMTLAHYEVGDAAGEAHAMVSLVEESWASQQEVARGFGCSTRTVRRMQRRAEEGGIAALVRTVGYPKGRPRLDARRRKRLLGLKTAGRSNREIATILGVSEKAVRNALRRLGWREAMLTEPELPFAGADPNVSASSPTSPVPPSAQSADGPIEHMPGLRQLADSNVSVTHAKKPTTEASARADAEPSPVVPARAGADANVSAPTAATSAPLLDPAATSPEHAPAGADSNVSVERDPDDVPWSLDRDPADRRLDRILAVLGAISDASPIFRDGTRIPHAGVLLALPALLDTGVLDCARSVYGSLGPAFYGLRTTVVVLLLMALLRIKRPEALKEQSPEDLGRLLGLDRAPEVKTLRRKLSRLAALGGAVEFGRMLAARRVATHGSALGFLYIDGHVRVYHGEHTIPKAHVTRMRIAMPATTDYWVNDARGDPLFVVTAEANAGMVKMLPALLEQTRGLVGDRRITVVFDRGGWSPKLFLRILAAGFDVLTYRKGRSRRVPRNQFHERSATIEGREVEYTLADQRIRLLDGKLTLRQVTRLSEDGHQTPIVTSRTDLPDIEVAFRMFERWRQENFFKYLREEYALDALADHRTEPADPTRDVPNPARKALDAELHRARAAVAKLASAYGIGAFDDAAQLCVTLRTYKHERTPQAQALSAALERVSAIEARRAKVPVRVPVAQAIEGPVVQLATERKHLTNLFKLVAYQAESELTRAIAPYYKRTEDEGRTLVQTALASAADIRVTATELHVTLAPLSSAHRTAAIAALCEDLNRTATRFPGTDLRLRFGIHPPPNTGSLT
jgi:transposase